MIDILLATYNGGRFLKEQLDSLLNQTQGELHVLIQDDGSKDNTAELLTQYTSAHPEMFFTVTGPAHEKSPKGNFMSLLTVSKADYILFCDQDDVWEREKVSLTYQAMQQGEELYGKDTPILVHTDLAVADEKLGIISPSFWRYQKLDRQPPLTRLLCQNSITGCTMMINAPLRDLMLKAPAESMLMHDWWAAILAASMGHLLTVNKPLIRYRQHGGNQLGATGFVPVKAVQKASANSENMRTRLKDTFSQAETFLCLYQSVLPQNAAKTISRYASIPHMAKAKRMTVLMLYGYRKKGILRSLGQLYYC